MTFLAPWALGIGAFAALGMVMLHLVARQRPAAFVLPTTRFIPDQRTMVSRAAARPRDLLLLLLRVFLILAAATAFARPVVTPARGSIARVVMLDRSRAVLDPREAASRARLVMQGTSQAVLITFDTTARVSPPSVLDSLEPSARPIAGSLSSALVAARRAAASLSEHADSVQLVLVSPVLRSELDSGTRLLRAHWPGGVRIERVAARQDTTTSWQLEHAIPLTDPLGPAMRSAAGGRGALVTRLVRGPLSSADSDFAAHGGTVVRWDSAATQDVSPRGLVAGENVIVALLGRITLAPGSRVIASWSDGAAAATERVVGTGCIRQVGIVVPAAGDLPLHEPFEHIVRQLLAPCGALSADTPVDSATLARLAGAAAAVPSSELRPRDLPPTPLVKWLLALALALAIAELLVRDRAPVIS